MVRLTVTEWVPNVHNIDRFWSPKPKGSIQIFDTCPGLKQGGFMSLLWGICVDYGLCYIGSRALWEAMKSIVFGTRALYCLVQQVPQQLPTLWSHVANMAIGSSTSIYLSMTLVDSRVFGTRALNCSVHELLSISWIVGPC